MIHTIINLICSSIKIYDQMLQSSLGILMKRKYENQYHRYMVKKHSIQNPFQKYPMYKYHAWLWKSQWLVYHIKTQ
jgi:hypothetical protein